MLDDLATFCASDMAWRHICKSVGTTILTLVSDNTGLFIVINATNGLETKV